MPVPIPPILITAFNRADTVMGVLHALAVHQPPKLYVACDGPRPHVAGEEGRVAEVRRLLLSPPWRCEVHARFLTENQGCGKAMSGAITWFFEQEARGIVLEDDCVPAPDFVPFCAEVLERHADNPRVMSVGGTRHAREQQGQRTSYTYSRLFTSVGWASWSRAWSHFRFDISGWRDEFGPDGIRSRGLPEASVTGWSRKIDWPAKHGASAPAWAYQWVYAHLLHNAYCALPKVNLITNTGFANNATHTSKSSAWADMPTGQLEFPLVHPIEVVHDLDADVSRERFHMNHRPWLSRKIFHIRNNLGLISLKDARGW